MVLSDKTEVKTNYQIKFSVSLYHAAKFQQKNFNHDRDG